MGWGMQTGSKQGKCPRSGKPPSGLAPAEPGAVRSEGHVGEMSGTGTCQGKSVLRAEAHGPDVGYGEGHPRGQFLPQAGSLFPARVRTMLCGKSQVSPAWLVLTGGSGTAL